MIIRQYQLIKHRKAPAITDLSDENFFTVGEKAFFRNQIVEQIIFPPKMTNIKGQAMAKCANLQTVSLNSQGRVGISTAAMADCHRLEQVENMETVTAIGDRAFLNCFLLKNMEFGASLQRIGEGAFENCRSITEIHLPDGVKSIGKYAFSGCRGLQKATVGAGCTVIAKGTFRNCASLSEVNLPDQVVEIQSDAFRNCATLMQFRLPNGVKKLGNRAFLGCRTLKNLTTGANCRKIGAFAFDQNPMLEEVHLSNAVKHLGFGAFGLKKREKKIRICVNNEYMLRKIRRQLLFCGSYRCAEAVMVGKTIAERKRERHRSTLEQTAAHIS